MTRDTGWFKSSHSSGGSNGCLEVRFTNLAVDVRDSKHPTGLHFSFSPHAWRSFTNRISA
ncbi:DUF397 domain-containing protein [Saccharothrix australiensis]|uniref:Uncharacterized protein DUF397 n=1 Tax=Saccharothrix australiensis TaxID=2072 RepID=A0A495VR07_9PSEU|nr:DUF397 domain-containing protein [Saccharothrix australiensis]RKT51722.1 uncharacterized protein DUF397 [Saccharothrix australiensis]